MLLPSIPPLVWAAPPISPAREAAWPIAVPLIMAPLGEPFVALGEPIRGPVTLAPNPDAPPLVEAPRSGGPTSRTMLPSLGTATAFFAFVSKGEAVGVTPT